MIFGSIRIGEASNPGPAAHFEDFHFTLGTFNPSGLRNKAPYLSTHLIEGDIWTVSETHFFGQDVMKFRNGLRAANAVHKYFVPDAKSSQPCLTSQTSWKGVAVLSKYPTRALPNGLPESIQSSGRALLTATLVSDAWISGGVVYGEPDGHKYPHHSRNNEFLLHHVASHICHLCTGFRFVSGDWNELQNSLPAFDLLHQAGFRDIQDLAWERWGYPIQNTCKSRTRKDFLYISPGLQQILSEVRVLHDVWPDHATLVAQFRSPLSYPVVHTWPTPVAFPWPKDFGDDIEWNETEEPTVAYQLLWQQIEQSAAKVCPFPIPAQALGRAQRLCRKPTCLAQFAPVKIGRKGDFQPAFFGTSRRHAQWLRQVRRLQAYARLCSSDACHVDIQKAESWGAICRASGFMPSFAQWWCKTEFRSAGAPLVCPANPPDGLIAWAMFDSLSMALRDFESQLMKQSRQYARYRRCQNPNLIFADIRPPAVPGVELLLQPVSAKIEEVCHEENKLILDHDCPFSPDRPIVCNGQVLPIIHHDSDAIWCEGPVDVPVGAPVTQTRLIGTHEDLAKEFIAAWRDRWMRHADVPPDRWNTIIEFAKAHMPSQCFQWPAIAVEDLRSVVKHKKKASSHGLDGVRLSDLQCMPSKVLQAFCGMFSTAESQGSWPEQLVCGKVVSLAKVPTPGSPSDFRPITVFGLLYRCWSSFHARAALAALEEFLPDTLYGSRSGRHASQLWSKLLWAIEWSYQNQCELAGFVLDLQKAFNMLPRLAIFEIAAHVGLPSQVLLGWAGALTQMKRYFLIRHSLSPGVPSVTGFPEGCGLSCVAMVLVDAAFHKWQQVFFPMCTALSYVDDWQILCSHPSLIQGAKRVLDDFVHAMDLKVDGKKSFAWALSTEGRKLLRDQGTSVVLAAKNLGAHVQMSRKHTNASLMERVNSVQAIWPKLRLSACRYATKVKAVLMAAWPRALHAVAATTLSDAAFHSLRTGAMKGLDSDGSGCNAWLQLGMIEKSIVDPQFWATVQTVRGIRECGEASVIEPRLAELAFGSSLLPTNGITSTLLTRIQTLGWHVTAEGLIADRFGKFSLFQASLAEITLRAEWAWHQVVACKVDHRPGLRNLQFADPWNTRSWLKQLAHDDQILFHKCLNGCHITQDGKVYSQEGGSDVCPFCSCVDSRFHRLWECEHFASQRQAVTDDLKCLVAQLPEFLTCYGWSLKPYTLHTWFSMLSAIEVPEISPLQPVDGDLHLFTDGSCFNPAFPHCRVASWAVTCVNAPGSFVSHNVGSGPLPGFIQSSYRAEVFAVWQAILLARNQRGKVFLWTDCNAVVLKLRKLLSGAEVRINSAHFDLWHAIHLALQDLQPGQLQITKVAAHQYMQQASSPLEEWCFWHNHIVDQTAAQAQFQRPDGFWVFL